MRHEAKVEHAAAVTRAKGKMYEYRVPLESHLKIPEGLHLEEMFPLAIASIGDFAAEYVSNFLGWPSSATSTSEDVQFAAMILGAYVDARLDGAPQADLLLLSSAGYYLCDMPGNASVQRKRIDYVERVAGDDKLVALYWALGSPWSSAVPEMRDALLRDSCDALRGHYAGEEIPNFNGVLNSLRQAAYESESAHSLLLADLLCAVMIRRITNSSRSLLPQFSAQDVRRWEDYLQKPTALKELWPSQRLLGGIGIYRGSSAVVQMPTSAGKTRAIELILRSAILGERSNTSVIVAPFRALCEEIAQSLRQLFTGEDVGINYVSDVLADSADLIFTDEQPHRVIVVTPEKLVYLLRSDEQLIHNVGLLIFDEGHQFDAGSRGVVYELLVTSIRELLPRDAQIILISAVMQNPAALASWLLRDEDAVLADNQLQTVRNVAFASWPGPFGQLQFRDAGNSARSYFVPRVVQPEVLTRIGKERKPRQFPAGSDSSSLAVYLALKLNPNGAVAIFCGRKDAVSSLLESALDVLQRGVSFGPPAAHSDPLELEQLHRLFVRNFGEGNYLSQAARYGLFAHHGDTPHGIRLAIEYAMRTGLIRVVVCTSTLAQGVNLPIRYLLVTGTRQGQARMRVRDFQNLIGRVGRAGIHGEGTVIFTDTKPFDFRIDRHERWRWNEINELLFPQNTEPTGSSLLELVRPFKNDNGSQTLFVELDELLEATDSGDLIRRYGERMSAIRLSSDAFEFQLALKTAGLNSLQSYLMAYGASEEAGVLRGRAEDMARQTFAYSLASEEEKGKLIELFSATADFIFANVPGELVQRRLGKCLLGVRDAMRVDAWVSQNEANISQCEDEVQLFAVLAELLLELSPGSLFEEVEPRDAALEVAKEWLAGAPYSSLLDVMSSYGATYRWGAKRRPFVMDNLVALCERCFTYELPLLVAAIGNSYLESTDINRDSLRCKRLIDHLQRRLKYGLPTSNCTYFFEAGFAEREIAQEIDNVIWGRAESVDEARRLVREWEAQLRPIIVGFPSYFRSVFQEICTGGDRR